MRATIALAAVLALPGCINPFSDAALIYTGISAGADLIGADVRSAAQPSRPTEPASESQIAAWNQRVAAEQARAARCNALFPTVDTPARLDAYRACVGSSSP